MNKLYEELYFNSQESSLYMPNEVFDDLQRGIEKSVHIPFAYAYYYLISWLYRYAKYGNINIDNKMIKRILGYNPTYQEINYLIKKNGILDSMEYTSTVKDYPVSWTFENNELEFMLLSDFDKEMQKYINGTRSRKYSIKFPTKGFHRQVDTNDILDGTFYEISNTHSVPFEVFAFCMSKKEIGCTGFYIWCYLQMKNQMYENGYDVSLDGLTHETGVAKRTLIHYLGVLRGYRMVDCYYNQEYFCVALKEEDRNANTYKTNSWNVFSDVKVEYSRLRVMKKEEYERLSERKIDGMSEIEELFA